MLCENGFRRLMVTSGNRVDDGFDDWFDGARSFAGSPGTSMGCLINPIAYVRENYRARWRLTNNNSEQKRQTRQGIKYWTARENVYYISQDILHKRRCHRKCSSTSCRAFCLYMLKWGWAIPGVTRNDCHTRRHRIVTFCVTMQYWLIPSVYSRFFLWYEVDTLLNYPYNLLEALITIALCQNNSGGGGAWQRHICHHSLHTGMMILGLPLPIETRFNVLDMCQTCILIYSNTKYDPACLSFDFA